MTRMITATLEEMAAQAEVPAEELVPSIIDRLDDEDRKVFLAGLSERIVHDAAAVPRWVGSWFLSARIALDAQFVAADAEATKLVECGKVGPGLTSAELRARYGR